MLNKLLITLFLISTSFTAISNEKNKNTLKELEPYGEVKKLDNDNNKLKQAIDLISKIGTDEMMDNDGSTMEEIRNDPAVQKAVPVSSDICAKGIFERFILDPLLDLIFGKEERNKMFREEAKRVTGDPNSCPEEVDKKRREIADSVPDKEIDKLREGTSGIIGWLKNLIFK